MLEGLMGRVDDIEEAVDRFIFTSEEFYDKDLHEFIMEESSRLVRDLQEGCATEDEKKLIMNLLTSILEFASIDIKII